jgi:hypothetical protein
LVAAAAIVLVVGAALFVGVAGGGSVTTSTSEEVSFEAIPTDGTAIVFARNQSGGLEIFGARLRGRDSTFDIGFAVPESCVVRDDAGDEALRDDAECAGLPAYGRVVGGGVTRDGKRIVVVRLEVSEDCYEALPFAASAWPTGVEVCDDSA